LICEECRQEEKLMSQEYAILFQGHSLSLTGVSVFECACEREVEIPRYSLLLRRARQHPDVRHWYWHKDGRMWCQNP